MAALTRRQIGSVGIALLGLYFLGRSIALMGPTLAYLVTSAGDSKPALDISRLLALSALGIAIEALPGGLLVAFHDRLSRALFGDRAGDSSAPVGGSSSPVIDSPAPDEAPETLVRHVQVAAFSVLGVLFVVLGSADVVGAFVRHDLAHSWATRQDFAHIWATRPVIPWPRVAQIIFGLALFFGARGVARMWAAVRGLS